LTLLENNCQHNDRSNKQLLECVTFFIHYSFLMQYIFIFMNLRVFVCSLLLLIPYSISDAPKLPLYVGRSYDLMSANPLSDHVDPGFTHAIFDFTYKNKILTEDGKYMIPDGVAHRKVSSCAFSTDIRTYRGTKTYQDELKTKTTISGGYKGLIVDAAFSASAAY
jgi:hypothetical protein